MWPDSIPATRGGPNALPALRRRSVAAHPGTGSAVRLLGEWPSTVTLDRQWNDASEPTRPEKADARTKALNRSCLPRRERWGRESRRATAEASPPTDRHRLRIVVALRRSSAPMCSHADVIGGLTRPTPPLGGSVVSGRPGGLRRRPALGRLNACHDHLLAMHLQFLGEPRRRVSGRSRSRRVQHDLGRFSFGGERNGAARIVRHAKATCDLAPAIAPPPSLQQERDRGRSSMSGWFHGRWV
jgi:hypothetical protein